MRPPRVSTEFAVLQSENVGSPSIGLVQWDGCETGVQLLARADRSMYRGKQSMKTLRMA